MTLWASMFLSSRCCFFLICSPTPHILFSRSRIWGERREPGPLPPAGLPSPGRHSWSPYTSGTGREGAAATDSGHGNKAGDSHPTPPVKCENAVTAVEFHYIPPAPNSPIWTLRVVFNGREKLEGVYCEGRWPEELGGGGLAPRAPGPQPHVGTPHSRP